MTARATIPRWKTLLSAALANHTHEPVFQFATLDTLAPIPHVRSHIFRGFLSAEHTPSLPLLLTTTDSRTPKVQQLFANPNAELAWWIAPTKEQFRISGRVSVVTAPKHEMYERMFRAMLSNAQVDEQGGLAALQPAKYDWEAKRLELFKAMSPHMKASWCRPTPGTKLEGGPDEAKKWPETIEEPKEGDGEEARKNWETALGNFALVIIEPAEVDYLTMAIVPNRRFKFARAVDGGWDEEEVVP